MDWISKYKVVRRLLLILIAALIVYATLRVFHFGVKATQEYLALLGLLAVATGFYSTWRGREDRDS